MILLVGAGAVGTVLLAALGQQHGMPVRLYARDKDVHALDAAPQVRVDTVDGALLWSAPRPPLARTLDLTGVGYLVICVKFGALEALLDQLPAADQFPAHCTVVSTLNGIEPLRVLRKRLPGVRVVPVSVMYNAQQLGPLHARITTRPALVVGGGDAELAGVLQASGLQVQEARDESAVWGKLLINLANALCALTHASFEHLLRQPDLRRIFAAVLDEAVGVLEKAGIAYQLPMPIPYRRYRLLLLHGGPVTWWVARLRNGVRPGSYPSMVADVEQGRVTEVDQLNREVVRLGQAHGLPTPLACRIVALVDGMAGQTPPRYLSAAELRRELGV